MYGVLRKTSTSFLVMWASQKIKWIPFFYMTFYSLDFQPELLNKYGCSVQAIFTLMMEVMLHCCYNRLQPFLL